MYTVHPHVDICVMGNIRNWLNLIKVGAVIIIIKLVLSG